MEKENIDAGYFKKKIIDLCVRSMTVGMPRKMRDRHVLLKGIALSFDKDKQYSEKEINDTIRSWLNNIGEKIQIDHVSIRRELIDGGYLNRTPDGSTYQLGAEPVSEVSFDNSVNDLDVSEIVSQGKEEIERKKREFMQKKG